MAETPLNVPAAVSTTCAVINFENGASGPGGRGPNRLGEPNMPALRRSEIGLACLARPKLLNRFLRRKNIRTPRAKHQRRRQCCFAVGPCQPPGAACPRFRTRCHGHAATSIISSNAESPKQNSFWNQRRNGRLIRPAQASKKPGRDMALLSTVTHDPYILANIDSHVKRRFGYPRAKS